LAGETGFGPVRGRHLLFDVFNLLFKSIGDDEGYSRHHHQREEKRRDRLWTRLLVPTYCVTFLTFNSSAVEMMQITLETITIENWRWIKVTGFRPGYWCPYFMSYFSPVTNQLMR